MYQLPAPTWNRIAEEQPLLTPMANRLLVMDQDALDRALDQQATELTAQGVSMTVIAAYQQVVLLYWENEAFQAFAVDHPSVIPALPSVQSLDEALEIAALDRPLDSKELYQLSFLLQGRPK